MYFDQAPLVGSLFGFLPFFIIYTLFNTFSDSSDTTFVLNQINISFLLSLIVWLKIFNLVSFFESVFISNLLLKITSIQQHFLTHNFINSKKNFFYQRNKYEIYEECKVYQNFLVSIACFH